jgi:hypothetical protein
VFPFVLVLHRAKEACLHLAQRYLGTSEGASSCGDAMTSAKRSCPVQQKYIDDISEMKALSVVISEVYSKVYSKVVQYVAQHSCLSTRIVT